VSSREIYIDMDTHIFFFIYILATDWLQTIGYNLDLVHVFTIKLQVGVEQTTIDTLTYSLTHSHI